MGEWLGTWWPWVVQVAGLLLLAYFALRRRAASRSPAPASVGASEPPRTRDDPFGGTGYSSAPAGVAPAPAARQQAEPPVVRSKAAAKFDWQPLMSVLVTIAILASALYVILSNQQFPDAHQKWAFGAIGTIVGYWLKK